MRLLIAATLILVGCFPPTAAVPAPISESEYEALHRGGAPTLADLSAGRGLFSSGCGSCHNHPDVAAHGSAEWARIVERMGRKADLSPAESDLVLAFILAARERSLPPR